METVLLVVLLRGSGIYCLATLALLTSSWLLEPNWKPISIMSVSLSLVAKFCLLFVLYLVYFSLLLFLEHFDQIVKRAEKMK